MPTQILNCEQLKEKMKVRTQLIQRVEGKAYMKDDSGRFQVLISLRSDRQFWIEIRSPIGGPFAVLRADEDWVEFFIPRRKEIYRIPSSEFWRTSPRQIKFLQLLPVKIKPEQLIDLVIGRFNTDRVMHCHWNKSRNAYAILLKNEERNAYAFVDPIAFFPIQSGLEQDVFMVKQSDNRVYQAETLEFATAFDFYQNQRKEMSFEWIELSWRAEIGLKPPFFPDSLGVKRINY